MKMPTKIIPVLVSLLLLLTSCSYNPFISVTGNQTTGNSTSALVGAAAGAGITALFGAPRVLIGLGGIGGGALGYYVSTLRYDAGGILRGCGQIYKVGDFIGIYLPADLLFEPNTAELLPQANLILDSVAAVLRRFPCNNILISGSTSGFSYHRFEQCLSEKRAQRIAAYLWSVGINHFEEPGMKKRQLTYVGNGDYFPIATHLRNEGIRQNNHIQITSYPSRETLVAPCAPQNQVFKNYAGWDG